MISEDLEYAMFSRQEMDSRYARARELMGRRGIDALLISGEENFQYFAGTAASLALHYSLTRPSIFILPADREPIIVTQGKDNLILGSYVTDIRQYDEILSFPLTVVLDAIGDAGLKRNRLGVELGLEQRMGMPVGAYLNLVSRMSDTEFVDAADIIVGLRMVKSGEELAYMKLACEVTGLARQRLFGQVVPGMTEREVARRMRQLVLEEGGDRTSFVILQLDVAGSKNQFHYDRPLQAGTILAVDAGAYVGMYTVDYVRMASLGCHRHPEASPWCSAGCEREDGGRPETWRNLLGDIPFRRQSDRGFERTSCRSGEIVRCQNGPWPGHAVDRTPQREP